MVVPVKIILTDEQRNNVKKGLREGRKVPNNKVHFYDDFNQDSKNFLKKTFGDAGILVTFEVDKDPDQP